MDMFECHLCTFPHHKSAYEKWILGLPLCRDTNNYWVVHRRHEEGVLEEGGMKLCGAHLQEKIIQALMLVVVNNDELPED